MGSETACACYYLLWGLCLSGYRFKHSLTQNILALYGVHFANYLFPLITVPYLARVLGPKEWGLLAFTQAFGGISTS